MYTTMGKLNIKLSDVVKPHIASYFLSEKYNKLINEILIEKIRKDNKFPPQFIKDWNSMRDDNSIPLWIRYFKLGEDKYDDLLKLEYGEILEKSRYSPSYETYDGHLPLNILWYHVSMKKKFVLNRGGVAEIQPGPFSGYDSEDDGDREVIIAAKITNIKYPERLLSIIKQ